MTTSEQARLDSLSDAETLRALVFAKTEGDACYIYPADHERAEFGLMHYTQNPAVKARAAFRAVPALRGEG